MFFIKSLIKKINSIIFFSLWVQTSLFANQQDIVSLYTKSLDLGKEEEVIVDKKKKLTLQIQYPSRDQMRFIAMNQVAKLQAQQASSTTELDRMFLKKMELLCGEEDPKNSLLSKIDNTGTAFGHVMLASTTLPTDL